MLLGRTPFQSVLDRLDAENEEQADGEASSFSRIQGLGSGFAVEQPCLSVQSSRRPDQDYVDNLLDVMPAEAIDLEKPAEEPPAPQMPEHLNHITLEEIEAELAISAEDTVQSLGDKRRHFAKTNHPDSVHADFRPNATIRMTIANSLIDKALRRLAY
ncbi:hypothetical protein [Oryzifoliimicrobium ureilyticus]|uniref:hypothetical protein n=1 Tax=Oryzifoliimicrobium ureilyticus TaxID=3113724 RepID=UPI003076864B